MATSFCAVELEKLEIKSFVRNFHAYMDIWTPEEGERINLIREPIIHCEYFGKSDCHNPFDILHRQI